MLRSMFLRKDNVRTDPMLPNVELTCLPKPRISSTHFAEPGKLCEFPKLYLVHLSLKEVLNADM